MSSVLHDQLPTSMLHDQLPVVLAADAGIAKLLGVVAPTASQIYDFVGAKEHLFDPAVAPLAMVRWLADWIGVTIDERLPEATQRRLLRVAAASFPRRGTAAALRASIEALVAGDVEVHDHGWIALPAPDQAPTGPPPPGIPATVGTDVPLPIVIVVRGVDEQLRAVVQATIEGELRADIPYVLTFEGAS